jgi:hypothetical protein
MAIGYKVVRRDKGYLRSYVCSLAAVARYRKDCFVRPKEGNGPLAVFDTLKDAIAFRASDQSKGNYDGFITAAQIQKKYPIFKCEYTASHYHDLWETYTCGYKLFGTLIPSNTKFADKVKLIKKVG